MTRSQVRDLIVEEFNVNHIFATSVATRIDRRIRKYEEIKSFFVDFCKNKPKPFVKWVGGKRQLLEQFKALGLYPPRNFDAENATYFEPFVGGGAVFFDLLPKNAVLSDWNEELVTTYNVIKDDVDNLIESLKNHKNEKEYFLSMRAKDLNELSDVEIASRFIYLNRTCFNGMYRVNKSGGFNVPFGKQKKPLICDEDNLRKVSAILENVSISKRDYKDVLNEAKKGDFVYFDPPYYPLNRTSNFTSYTADGFLEKEQEELRDTYFKLHKRGCFVMLSNSNTEFIRNIYSGLDKKIKINEVSASRMINSVASKRGKIKEVLVVNY
ncbi:MAG: DNA adenine methylase [Candidatus Moranbacteria bacterium]|nr:DNA adenine methylase [Candidatus Moranbacteria bacterium]